MDEIPSDMYYSHYFAKDSTGQNWEYKIIAQTDRYPASVSVHVPSAANDVMACMAVSASAAAVNAYFLFFFTDSPPFRVFRCFLLEYPQYSRPEEWHGKQVPKVLLSGNQRKIAEWRRQEAERRTQERRPDLYAGYERLMSCKKVLAGDKLLHVDMTELIARGQARLVFAEGKNICLQDKVSGAYFHTAEDIKAGCRMLEILHGDAGEESGLLVLHQEFMTEPTEKYLGFRTAMTCNQIVYTKHEKLPVTGLYRMDGKPAENGVVIRPLTMEHLDAVVRDYNTISDEAYVTDRIKKGALFGAFVDGQLAGFIGMHAEGGIGMLFVSPEYRRRRIGMALETYMINLGLERGERPYGQVEIGNDASKGLQEALGLCFSKGRIYWMEREERE